MECIKSFDQLRQSLSRLPVKRRGGVAPAQDPHTLEAIALAVQYQMIDPVLIGLKEEINHLMEQTGVPPEAVTIIAEDDIEASVQKAADLARAGEIDCIMKGKIETGQLMRVLVNKERGIRKNDTMSLLAFMESRYYHKVFAITDVGLLTYPTLEQKKAAIQNAVNAYHALGVSMPKVAVLAAVEKVNPKMRETVEADEIKAQGMDGCVIEGPISLDLAMDPEAAPIKGYASPVAGDADILVVPDIVSGNLLAKSITVVGGGKTGGVVMGARVPVLLVSRSATAEDKYMSIVIAALIGQNN